MSYTCPVCYWNKLEEAPFSSFEICPSCGVQFGYNDVGTTWEALRKLWLDNMQRPFK